MKRIYSVFLFAGGLLLVALITASILLRAYSTDIQKVVISKLNKQLNAKADVGEIRFSVLKHFPYLSATFRSVTLKGPGRGKGYPGDPLLNADEVILDMNIIDALLYKKISIKRIVVQKGRVHLIGYGKNKYNWDILKKDKTAVKKKAGKKNPLKIHLFRIINVGYVYEDKEKGTIVKGEIKRATWNGGWWPGSEGEFKIRHAGLQIWDDQRKRYDFPDGFDLNGHLQTDETAMHLDKMKLSWHKFQVLVSGNIGRSPGKNTVKLTLQASDLKVDEMVKYLEDRSMLKMKGNKAGGRVSLEGELSGQGSAPFQLSAILHLKGEDGTFLIAGRGQKLQIKSWTAEINIRSGKSSLVSFHLLPSPVRSGKAGLTMEAFWKIRDNKPADMDVLLKGSVRVNDLYGWTGKNFAEIIKSGKISGDVKVRIPAGVLKPGSRGKLSDLKISGWTTYRDIVVFNDTALFVKNLKTVLVPGRDIELQGGEVVWTGNPWQIQGRVKNMMEYLDGERRAVFYTDLKGSMLDIDQMLSFFRLMGDVSKGMSPGDKKWEIPRIESTVSVDTLRYKGFTAGNAKGFLIYDDPVVLLKKTTLYTMEGKGSGMMELTLNGEGPDRVKTYLEPEHINVRELFRSFDNFGQDFIRAENLKGYVSGNISFQALFDDGGKMIKPSALSDSYLEITQGELIGFEPLYKLSKFIRLSELQDIRFSTLKNEIFIHDQQVVIPDMEIKSSALNLSVSGVHHFAGDFDYRISILLSDYLSRKAKNKNRNNSEFGEVVEDQEGKTTLFLRYQGNSKESKVYYDRKKVKEKISKELKEEKKVLKDILHGGNGSLQGNSSGFFTEADSVQGKRKFRVEWPEEENKIPEKKKQDTVHKKKFKVIWEEEPDTTQKK